ncbi:UDP-glucuronosyltransferase 2B17-like [Trichosurus vulpecula]|uniref:UDP-glucuronosyltransferase 2B17-like n=1 Tax=Trichosurus vulpecula TaxID=9337 RepID=UPI00186B555C|nr:UDP-glucuronosyltransferase 2B17-like [Trichosurus vulpecula]
MNSEKWVSALLLLQLCCFSCGSCGKVLAWPMEYSHWLNLKALLDGLVQKGHEVTVLMPSATVFVDAGNSSGFHVEVFPMETNQEDLASLFENWITLWSNEFRKLSALEYGAAMQKLLFEYSGLIKQQCESAVLNKDLMKTLKDARYEVVVSDAMSLCGELIAEVLGIPFIYSLRFSMGNTLEKYCGGLPSPPSYVPVPMTILTDKMTFMERVKNMLFFIYYDFWFQNFEMKVWDQFYSDVLGNSVYLYDSYVKSVQ